MKILVRAAWGCAIAFAIAVISAVVSSEISERMASQNELEYRVQKVPNCIALPQGLERKVTFNVAGKTYDDVGMLQVSLFNRTSQTFTNLPIHPLLVGGTAQIIGKMLLYPTDEDSEHFAWDNPNDADLKLTARGLNRSTNESPVVELNLFFVGKDLPDVTLSTPGPGILFVPYDQTKVFWFLFGYDTILIPAFIVCFVVLIIAVIWQLRVFMTQLRAALFKRVLDIVLIKERDRAGEAAVYRIVDIAVAVFNVTMRRRDISWRGDEHSYALVAKAIEIPVSTPAVARQADASSGAIKLT